MVSALLAAWLIHTTPGSAQFSFSIFTDNQSLVRSLTKCSSGLGCYLINPFRQIINTLQAPLKVIWISGHRKVQGNKEADDLVKRAVQGQLSPPLDLPLLLCRPLPHSANAEKQLYTQEIKTMWSEQWNDSPRCTCMEHIDKSFPFTHFRKILHNLSRAQSSLLIQICSSHIPLNAHLYRLTCIDMDKCQACITHLGTSPAKETIPHFLFDCPAYQNE